LLGCAECCKQIAVQLYLALTLNYSVSIAAVALALEAQLVQSVPTAPHDIDVDILATAKGFVACSTSGKEALSVAAPL